MAWLAKLDARMKAHSWPLYWAYVALKWYLALLGAFMVFRLYLDRMGIWPLFTE